MTLGQGVNRMMIANFVTKPYSHTDAKFMTRLEDHKRSSFLQVRGACIQSATYSIIGVVIEYQIKKDHIVGAKHAMAVEGCTTGE